jgi:DNA-binding transcriptional LysR family regulator
MLNVEVVRSFLLVATHGSFSAAARASGRPKSTLSRHVIGLEQHLSVCLLDRSEPAVRPTEAGERFRRLAVRIVKQVSRLEAELGAFAPGGARETEAG